MNDADPSGDISAAIIHVYEYGAYFLLDKVPKIKMCAGATSSYF